MQRGWAGPSAQCTGPAHLYLFVPKREEQGRPRGGGATAALAGDPGTEEAQGWVESIGHSTAVLPVPVASAEVVGRGVTTNSGGQQLRGSGDPSSPAMIR